MNAGLSYSWNIRGFNYEAKCFAVKKETKKGRFDHVSSESSALDVWTNLNLSYP
jgi:hypothetical protein